MTATPFYCPHGRPTLISLLAMNWKRISSQRRILRITKDFTPNGGKDLPGLMVIVGPTAIGKSRLALEIAPPKIDGEIVSADSAQVYRYLNIGTAKPSRLEQKKKCGIILSILSIPPGNSV